MGYNWGGPCSTTEGVTTAVLYFFGKIQTAFPHLFKRNLFSPSGLIISL